MKGKQGTAKEMTVKMDESTTQRLRELSNSSGVKAAALASGAVRLLIKRVDEGASIAINKAGDIVLVDLQGKAPQNGTGAPAPPIRG